MEACLKVSSSVPLKLLATVNEEMIFWNSGGMTMPISGPDLKSRYTVFAVNCEKIKISVERCKHVTLFGVSNIDSWRRDQYLSMFNKASKSRSF